jgi:hypothetical protein
LHASLVVVRQRKATKIKSCPHRAHDVSGLKAQKCQRHRICFFLPSATPMRMLSSKLIRIARTSALQIPERRVKSSPGSTAEWQARPGVEGLPAASRNSLHL